MFLIAYDSTFLKKKKKKKKSHNYTFSYVLNVTKDKFDFFSHYRLT